MGHPETGTQKGLLLEESTETLKVCILEEELEQRNVLLCVCVLCMLRRFSRVRLCATL